MLLSCSQAAEELAPSIALSRKSPSPGNLILPRSAVETDVTFLHQTRAIL